MPEIQVYLNFNWSPTGSQFCSSLELDLLGDPILEVDLIKFSSTGVTYCVENLRMQMSFKGNSIILA